MKLFNNNWEQASKQADQRAAAQYEKLAMKSKLKLEAVEAKENFNALFATFPFLEDKYDYVTSRLNQLEFEPDESPREELKSKIQAAADAWKAIVLSLAVPGHPLIWFSSIESAQEEVSPRLFGPCDEQWTAILSAKIFLEDLYFYAKPPASGAGGFGSPPASGF